MIPAHNVIHTFGGLPSPHSSREPALASSRRLVATWKLSDTCVSAEVWGVRYACAAPTRSAIVQGRVSIDGNTVHKPATRVDAKSVVSVDGKQVIRHTWPTSRPHTGTLAPQHPRLISLALAHAHASKCFRPRLKHGGFRCKTHSRCVSSSTTR